MIPDRPARTRRRTGRPVLLVLAAVLALGSCAGVSRPAAPPTPAFARAANPAPAGTGLADPQTGLRAAQIISSFENSTTDIQYGYAENIDDGRGVTAGRAGFTSATGDLLLVVQRYAAQRPDSPLARYLPALQAVDGTGSTAGLDGFAAVWRDTSATDPLLNQVQDQVSDELYFDPAMARARQLGIRTALGQLVIWDTIVQHGEGDDPDGLPAIQQQVVDRYGPVAGDEAGWLRDFLEVRRTHLLDPADPSTRDAWRDSVSRVDALESLIDAGDLDLHPPLTWQVHGDRFTLR